MDNVLAPKDTVMYKIRTIARNCGEDNDNLAIAMMVYLLDLGGYKGL